MDNAPYQSRMLESVRPILSRFVVDEMAKASGHEVVWPPPYDCEHNPIELAWSHVKHKKVI